MPRPRYVPVSVPEDLLVDVDRVVQSGLFGYRSRSEFVLAAVREKIQGTFDLQATMTRMFEERGGTGPPPPRRGKRT